MLYHLPAPVAGIAGWFLQPCLHGRPFEEDFILRYIRVRGAFGDQKRVLAVCQPHPGSSQLL